MSADGSNDAVLWDVAGAVVDGDQVDWATAGSSAPAECRSRLGQLKRIAKVVGGFKESQRADSSADDNAPAETWGHLEILEKIGEGAFGEVYLARDPRLDRQVALKFFRPHRLSSSPLTSDIIEEGRLLARVRHPNVVTVYGAERLDGRVGIWMEYIDGATLEEIIAEKGPLSATEAMMIGRDLCQALTALHEAGVIHRDIKARNVMREEGGRIVLMDLGVSCEVDRQVPIAVYGTPLYAAPEVLRANAATCQTDVYSVGVLLFYLVSGQYPVSGSTLAEINEAHEVGRYQQLKELEPDLAESFTNIIDQAQAPDPAQRFASAAQLEQTLADALRVDEAGGDDRRTKSYTDDQQAYNRYLQGRYFWTRRFHGGLPRAMEFFRQAIERDPDFALARVGIADCLNQLSHFQYIRPREGFPQARAAAERALELDPDLGEAHASLGWICMCYDWDFAASERHYQRAMQLCPQYALARQWYALLLSAEGRHDEALAEVRAGRELDPSSLVAASEATVLTTAGHFDEAIEIFRLTLETDPDSLIHNTNMGAALWRKGDVEEGERCLRKAVQLSNGEDSYSVGLLATGLALSGRDDEALEVIGQLEALARKRYVSFWHRALPWLFLDRHDKWGPLLEKAIEERDPFLIWIRPNQVYVRWHADPRFAEPLRRAGLLD